MSATPSSTVPVSRGGELAFTILLGLTTLGVLAQSVLAGVFLQYDGRRGAYHSYVDAHGVGGQVTTTLALLTTIVAAVALRPRRSLVVGSAVLLAALVAETVLGYLVSGKIGSPHPRLTVVHIPLGLLIMAVATYLSTRSATLRRAAAAT